MKSLAEAAQAMVEAFQPHVMDERCRVCNLAWQNLRETLRALCTCEAPEGMPHLDTCRLKYLTAKPTGEP